MLTLAPFRMSSSDTLSNPKENITFFIKDIFYNKMNNFATFKLLPLVIAMVNAV